jgi:AAA+ ATPase superfamily predicted ATPase
MNVVFGATSVGKTALLRQVLAGEDFFVIKFDLRISGFADLRTLYIALCEQFKSLFEEVRSLLSKRGTKLIYS